MSHFYSSCQGGRGMANRAGHKSTGIRASVQSHAGSIQTRLYMVGEAEWAEITVSDSSSAYGYTILYHGPLADLLSPAGRLALLRSAALQPLREDLAA